MKILKRLVVWGLGLAIYGLDLAVRALEFTTELLEERVIYFLEEIRDDIDESMSREEEK